jgi:hypothetical protein
VKRKSVALLVLAIVGLGITYWFGIRPWTVLPAPEQEIHDAWLRVEGWGTVPPACQEDMSELEEALSELRENAQALPEYSSEPGQAQPVALSSLPRSLGDALVSLERWRDTAGGFDAGGLEEDGGSALQLLRLARLGLATLGDIDAFHDLTTVAFLGHRLVTCGNLIQAAVGGAILQQIADTVEQRPELRVSLLGVVAFDVEQVFGVLARQALWSYELASQAVDAESLRDQSSLSEDSPTIFSRLSGLERELLVLKWVLATHLEELAPHAGDLSRLRDLLVAQTHQELPRSVLVELMAMNIEPVVARLQEARQALIQAGAGY